VRGRGTLLAETKLAPLGGWAEGGPLVTVENDSAVTGPAADVAEDSGIGDSGIGDSGIGDSGIGDAEELLVEEISIDGMCGVY
jgi:mycofactocin precursor